jgi:hypothetical protein
MTLRATALPDQIDLLHRTFAGEPGQVAVLTPAGPTMTLVSEIWSPTAPPDSLAGILTRPHPAGTCSPTCPSQRSSA